MGLISCVAFCSTKEPASLASEVEEPCEDGWDKHLPDAIETHVVEDSEPDVHWKEEEYSRQVASVIPDPVNEESRDTAPAVHVEVLVYAIRVELLACCISTVVPEEAEVGIAKCTNESLRKKWGPW